MYLGDFAAGDTVQFKWNTTAVGIGSITRATNGSIRIYKDGSATQRTSANGITDTEDFDSLTGVHHLTIDLSDNTDAGFYAAGSDYQVVLQGAVIGGETINAVLAHFSIENRRFLTAAAVNAEVDQALADYDGPTNTEMVAAFTEIKGSTWATTDTLEAIRDRGDSAWITATGFSTHSAADVRSEMDSNSTQLAAIVADTNELQTDWADGGRLDLILDARASQASVNTIDGIVDDILLDTAEIGAAGAGLTEAGGDGDHLTAINLPDQTMNITGNITGNLSGSVGSVTGNVGGNVVGSVGSVTGAINTAAGTITTLDDLDTAQDSQHSTTQSALTTVDSNVDAIKAKTDDLTFSVANKLDANITHVNEIEVTGNGQTGTEWGPA